MKKLALAALAASAFAATPAFANSQNTVIYAQVPLTCQITAPANNGSIDLNGQTPIGNVTVAKDGSATLPVQATDADGDPIRLTATLTPAAASDQIGVDVAPITLGAAGGFATFVEVTNPALHYAARVFYIAPEVTEGQPVRLGAELGKADSLQARYPGITDHVHLELMREGRRFDAQTVITARLEQVTPRA